MVKRGDVKEKGFKNERERAFNESHSKFPLQLPL